jgi:hypothetical protein
MNETNEIHIEIDLASNCAPSPVNVHGGRFEI